MPAAAVGARLQHSHGSQMLAAHAIHVKALAWFRPPLAALYGLSFEAFLLYLPGECAKERPDIEHRKLGRSDIQVSEISLRLLDHGWPGLG